MLSIRTTLCLGLLLPLVNSYISPSFGVVGVISVHRSLVASNSALHNSASSDFTPSELKSIKKSTLINIANKLNLSTAGTKIQLIDRLKKHVDESEASFDVDSLLSSHSPSPSSGLSSKVAIEVPPSESPSIPSPSTSFDFTYDKPLKTSKTSQELEKKITTILEDIIESEGYKNSQELDVTKLDVESINSLKSLCSSPSSTPLLSRIFSSLYIRCVAEDGVAGDDPSKGGGNYIKLTSLDGYITGVLKATRDKLVRDRVSRLLSTDNSGSEVAKVIEEGLGGEVCEFLKLKESQVTSDILKNLRTRVEAEMYVRNSSSGWCVRLLYDLQVLDAGLEQIIESQCGNVEKLDDFEMFVEGAGERVTERVRTAVKKVREDREKNFL
ncbi:hypothetical protein TrVE_jg3732 [Triparma verrucosa]|uniref:SAP domain-containing protein n=1 Tax=Triparma verrucosa TaxID=1606542 RepID=A0A9W7B800_9STRA|nr:hypothetical protein TrVE_jg3732 [Triparma verrucosa]